MPHRQPPQPVRSALVHFLNLGVKVNLACCGLDNPRPFLAAKRDLYSVFAGSEALQLSSILPTSCRCGLWTILTLIWQ
jgi:hypothetical protein